MDLSKEITIIQKPKVTREELLAAYTAEEEIKGFIGGVEIDSSKLSDLVPLDWPNSFRLEANEDEEPKEIQKDFSEYGIKRDSLNGEKALLIIGYRDSNGNRVDVVSSEEFYLWAGYFGIENILTKSEMILKVNSEEYLNLDE